ncbi:MAG: DUF4329 domain-containing protein [Elusimicrobiota bacterium]
MKSALLSVALTAALSASAAAGSIPKSNVTETLAYASAEQAAVEALKIAMPLSGSYENGGFIAERDGEYFYSDPVSAHEEGHISFAAVIPAGARLAAIYHTHPGASSEYLLFSSDDVKEARALGVDSYIGVLDDHTVRRFEPGRTPTRPFAAPAEMLSGMVSDGVIVATVVNF